MSIKTCVQPTGRFLYGIHKPAFSVCNLRQEDYVFPMGKTEEGIPVINQVNFPEETVREDDADWIYEIPNAFPFKGTTYITKSWAESKSAHPEDIFLPQPSSVSLCAMIEKLPINSGDSDHTLTLFIKSLPEPLLLALASTSTDPRDLVALAHISCHFLLDNKTKRPTGLRFRVAPGSKPQPDIVHHLLFEVVSNNPYLPEDYKVAMVLRPGIQGSSEIVGEWQRVSDSHVFEYLRRNSYIPWGHFAANMANDCVRYRIQDLTYNDLRGLRHLYYQRTFVRLAAELGLESSWSRVMLSREHLETLRGQILLSLEKSPGKEKLTCNRTLWGWNFGFDYAPSHYRLHASHQQIHQQYAMIPKILGIQSGDMSEHGELSDFKPYACGDLIEDFIEAYRDQTGQSFFPTYIKAIETNQRMDGRNQMPQALIVYREKQVILFVPKAQTSQWELQLMTLQSAGNIVEADTATREAIDRGIFIAVQILAAMGARLITSIEYAKRIDWREGDQRLLYAFLPRLPESPGAFSEAPLRWINGHYPEDFAAACRDKLPGVLQHLATA